MKKLRQAIKIGDKATVKNILDSYPSCLSEDTPFGSWLHVASSLGQIEIVKLLVEMGIDINGKGGVFNGTALKEAASEGHLDVVSYLLMNDAKLDVSEPERNPLFGAIYGGHIEIVKLLLNAGIDSSIKYSGRSMKNMDARAFAIERGQREIAVLLENIVIVRDA